MHTQLHKFNIIYFFTNLLSCVKLPKIICLFVRVKTYRFTIQLIIKLSTMNEMGIY